MLIVESPRLPRAAGENHGAPGYATEIVHLAEETGDREMALDGYGWSIVTLAELGDIQELDVQLAARTRLAQEMQHPYHLPTCQR